MFKLIKTFIDNSLKLERQAKAAVKKKGVKVAKNKLFESCDTENSYVKNSHVGLNFNLWRTKDIIITVSNLEELSFLYSNINYFCGNFVLFENNEVYFNNWEEYNSLTIDNFSKKELITILENIKRCEQYFDKIKSYVSYANNPSYKYKYGDNTTYKPLSELKKSNFVFNVSLYKREEKIKERAHKKHIESKVEVIKDLNLINFDKKAELDHLANMLLSSSLTETEFDVIFNKIEKIHNS